MGLPPSQRRVIYEFYELWIAIYGRITRKFADDFYDINAIKYLLGIT